MKASLTWIFAGALIGVVACDDGEQSLGENGECLPMDAHGDGQCDKGLGVVFNTDGGCIGIAGCECTGPDCDQVFANYDDCASTCHEGNPCTQTPNGMACPDNGICENGVCVYQ